MTFLEKNLEDIIWESDNEKLQERGLPIEGKKFRQLRIGNYGIADIITVQKCRSWVTSQSYLKITIYEFKKEKVGISAFLQAIKYAKGIQSYMSKRKITEFTLDIVLCGNKIDKQSDYIYICDLFYNDFNQYTKIQTVKNYEYNYDIDGISFERIKNFTLINEGF